VIRKYAKNAILVSEGDTSAMLYLIMKGQIKVLVSNEKVREALLNIYGPSEKFGETPSKDLNT